MGAAAGNRVHVYLTPRERMALEREMRERAGSASFVMRLALRALAGLPAPSLELEQEDERRAATG